MSGVLSPDMDDIRRLPAYQIKARLRRAGWRQLDVARQAGVSEAIVSRALGRLCPPGSEAAEKVWLTIKSALGGQRPPV